MTYIFVYLNLFYASESTSEIVFLLLSYLFFNIREFDV